MKRALMLSLPLVALLSGCGLVAWPGKSCRKHDECSGLKDGYCARAEICTKQCHTNSDCPNDSACATGAGTRKVCLPTCEGDGDCASNFSCRDSVCQLAEPLAKPHD